MSLKDTVIKIHFNKASPHPLLLEDAVNKGKDANSPYTLEKTITSNIT